MLLFLGTAARMKYFEHPRVTIADEKVPINLRHLTSLAKKWGIVGETDALRQIDHATVEQLREFVEAFQESRKDLQEFLLLKKLNRCCYRSLVRANEPVSRYEPFREDGDRSEKA